MSVDILICLFLRRDDLINGLKSLTSFEIETSGECNGFYWLGKTSVREIIERFPDYIFLIDKPIEEESRENTPNCTFVKDGLEVTLCFNPWLQAPFHILPQSQYIIVTLDFCNANNLSFMPIDHPSLKILQFTVKILKPIIGWFAGYDLYNYNEIYLNPVWANIGRPYILGSPLSTKVKEVVDLDNPNNGLFYCKHLDNGLYWIAPPGTMEIARSSYRADPVVLQKHLATAKKIENVLKTIPANILEP